MLSFQKFTYWLTTISFLTFLLIWINNDWIKHSCSILNIILRFNERVLTNNFLITYKIIILVVLQIKLSWVSQCESIILIWHLLLKLLKYDSSIRLNVSIILKIEMDFWHHLLISSIIAITLTLLLILNSLNLTL